MCKMESGNSAEIIVQLLVYRFSTALRQPRARQPWINHQQSCVGALQTLARACSSFKDSSLAKIQSRKGARDSSGRLVVQVTYIPAASSSASLDGTERSHSKIYWEPSTESNSTTPNVHSLSELRECLELCGLLSRQIS